MADRKEKDAETAKIIEEYKAKLIDMGTKYEAERNKTLVKRVWAWFTGFLGVGTIGGIIALCVLFPPFAGIMLSICGALIRFVVSAFPSLISFFGVVSKNTFQATVKGVGAIFDTLNTAKAEKRTYTAAEVEALMDKHLRENQDPSTQHVIDSFRKSIGL